MTEEPIDIRQLARATRFALVSIILGLSYFGVRAALSIDGSRLIFRDMLGEKPLPALTTFVIGAHLAFVIISLLIPALAVITLFLRNLVWSFYILGSLALLAVIQWIVLFNALSAPLVQIIQQLGGTSDK